MKNVLLALVTLSAWSAYGQGRVSFNNQGTFNSNDAITISANPNNMGSAGGNAGDGIGGDKYAVQLLWVVGTGFTQATFDAANPTASAVVTGVGAGGSPNGAFLANTGPPATFSGFFDGGPVQIGPTLGLYTMQVRAWYKIGFNTFQSAVSGGVNWGMSSLFTMNVTAAPAGANSTVFSGFQLYPPYPSPEPSSLAMAGVGATVMFLVRRKR